MSRDSLGLPGNRGCGVLASTVGVMTDLHTEGDVRCGGDIHESFYANLGVRQRLSIKESGLFYLIVLRTPLAMQTEKKFASLRSRHSLLRCDCEKWTLASDLQRRTDLINECICRIIT